MLDTMKVIGYNKVYSITKQNNKVGVRKLKSTIPHSTFKEAIRSLEKRILMSSTIVEKSITNCPLRDGDSGYLGRKYESIHNVLENNISGPDLLEDNIELKSKKPGSKSPDTLFSKEPRYNTDPEIGSSKDILSRFKNEDGKLNSSLKFGEESKNNLGFYLATDQQQKKLLIRNSERELPLASWSIASLLEKASEKLPNMKKAFFKDEDTYDEIKYENFQPEEFKKLLFSGKIVVEFRMRDGVLSEKAAKNRGTAFRINQNSIKEMYETTSEVRK